ncbi:MAG: glycosyltransferase [Rhodospirillales bacterium]|jgi:glycosyltransferase involved in cell wall biosynthesis|nr:glycosyltransferase [Rhodospirillales bacterium]
MIRVMQAMAGAQFGGAEAFFVRLAIGLHNKGLDQQLVIRNHPQRAKYLRDHGLDVIELPFGGRFDLKTRFAFKKAVAQFKPKLVLTWMNRATQFCPEGDFVHVGRLGGYYDLKYYQRCKHLIGNTEDIVEYLKKQGWAAERAHYLPNFVSAEKLPPIDRKSLFTPPNAPLILALGRLHKNKAFDVLLKAMGQVPDAYLWLAGEGELRAELEALAQQVGVKPRVRFLGWRDDVAALYAAADIFVCPSRHEPLGNVVLEAWAQGKPVIAADSYGPGTLIQHGENGLLVPVDDAQAMGQALQWMVRNPGEARRMAEAGQRTYESDFTEGRVVERYIEFFESIAGGA